MILLIDNFDSFTYNLYQYLSMLGADVIVKRNNEISIKNIYSFNPSKIVISPGPCTPYEAGISIEVVKEFDSKVPILGVCLGHQAIAVAMGGDIVQSKRIMHGKTSLISHDKKTIFKNILSPFEATRYHSLVIKKETFPKKLQVSAWTDKNEIMAVRSKTSLTEGVQFHPESILTDVGMDILRNFLDIERNKNE